jgi:hypothetical protein
VNEREELERERDLYRDLRKGAEEALREKLAEYMGPEDGEPPPPHAPESVQEYADAARTLVDMGDGFQRREDHILRRLEYLNMEDLTAASVGASKAVARATWVLACATIVLAVATVALIVVTAVA